MGGKPDYNIYGYGTMNLCLSAAKRFQSAIKNDKNNYDNCILIFIALRSTITELLKIFNDAKNFGRLNRIDTNISPPSNRIEVEKYRLHSKQQDSFFSIRNRNSKINLPSSSSSSSTSSNSKFHHNYRSRLNLYHRERD